MPSVNRELVHGQCEDSLPGEPKLLVFLGNFQNFGNFPKVAVIFATSPKIGNFHGKTQIIATLSLPVPFALI